MGRLILARLQPLHYYFVVGQDGCGGEICSSRSRNFRDDPALRIEGMVFGAGTAILKHYRRKNRQDRRNTFHNPFRRSADIRDAAWRRDTDAGCLIRCLVQHGAEAVVRLWRTHQHR
jgi:hypothetical protein